MRIRFTTLFSEFLTSLRLSFLLLISIVNFGRLNCRTSRMPRDFSILECVQTAHRLSSFNICIFILSSMEASNWVSIHCTRVASIALNETDHSLFAVRVKAAVVTGMNVCHQESLLILNRISGQSRLSIISKVRNEAHSIVKLNLESLVVDSRPFSSH